MHLGVLALVRAFLDWCRESTERGFVVRCTSRIAHLQAINIRCYSTDDTRLAPLSFSLLIRFPSGPSNLSDVVCSFVLLQCIANTTNVNLPPVLTTPIHRGNHRCGPCIAHSFVIPKYSTSEANFGSGHSDRCHISMRTPVYMFEYASRSLFVLISLLFTQSVSEVCLNFFSW
jgi:hypothetical protein